MSVTYRWINGPDATNEEWMALDKILLSQGWMAWNKETTMVRVAEDEKGIAAFFPVQLIPHTEPLYVREDIRGNGIADHLADDVIEWLNQIGVRGWMAIAQHPAAAKMCEVRGWKKLDAPVYMVMR